MNFDSFVFIHKFAVFGDSVMNMIWRHWYHFEMVTVSMMIKDKHANTPPNNEYVVFRRYIFNLFNFCMLLNCFIYSFHSFIFRQMLCAELHFIWIFHTHTYTSHGQKSCSLYRLDSLLLCVMVVLALMPFWMVKLIVAISHRIVPSVPFIIIFFYAYMCVKFFFVRAEFCV